MHQMASARYGMTRFQLLLLLAASFLLCQAQDLPVPAACPTNCSDALAYIGPRAVAPAVTLGQIAANFHADILKLAGANNLDVSDVDTLGDTIVQADTGLRVPLPACSCKGENYSSDGITYTVQSGDSLSGIASMSYAGLLPYQTIVAANSIPNPDLIQPGQVLTIPIPCSCVTPAASLPAVALSYRVSTGDNYVLIGQEFNTDAQSIQSLNPYVNASALIAETVIQVPISACSYNLSTQSLDSGLLVPYDAFAITASSCVQCSCSDNLISSCVPGPSSYPCTWSLVCPGTNLTIGSSSYLQKSNTSCEITTCIYEGYTQSGILTRLENRTTTGTTCQESVPPPPPPRAPRQIAAPPPKSPPSSGGSTAPLSSGGSSAPPPSPGAAPPRRLLEATWLAVVAPFMLLLV